MLTREQKIKLSDLLMKGHRQWGPVASRKPFIEDQEGGAGTAENVFRSHPLLSQQPVGAASDLTAIVTENNQSMQAADERSNEASNELQPTLEKALQQGKSFSPGFTPGG